MIPLVLFAILSIILLSTYSTKESIDATIPVSFPRTDTLKMPSKLVQANLQVRGPALLGINGSGTDITYIETNQSQIGFNSSGYDRSYDVLMHTNSNGMNIKAKSVALQADATSGATNAGNGNFGSLKVNRSDNDRYPNWGAGVHTWDLYANGTVGAGQDGNVASWMNVNGDMGCSRNASLPVIYGQTLRIKNSEVLEWVDGIRAGVAEMHRLIDERNRQRELERLRRLAEEAAAAIRRAAEAAANAARNFFRRRWW